MNDIFIEDLSELDEDQVASAPPDPTLQFRGVERPEMLKGITIKIRNVPNSNQEMCTMYMTINEYEGRPFEVFLKSSDKGLDFKTSAITLAISRQLRNDIPLNDIIKDLMMTYDDAYAHYIPDSKGVRAESVEWRLGYVLQQYVEQGGMNGLKETIEAQVLILKDSP